MIFAGDVISPTQEVDVSDFQSSLGEVSAAGLNLAYESGLAWSGAINTGLTGQSTYGLSAPDSPMFDHDTALQHVKNAGLSFDVPVEGVSRATLDLMIQRKRNQQKYMSIINRGGTGSSVAALAGGFVGAMADPAAIPFMFTPVPILTARLTSRLAMTEGILGRAAIRAQMGAAEGTLGAALMEPLLASNLKQLGDDYTMMDSLANVSFGAIAGGILGPGVGALGDFIETSFLGKTLGKEGFKEFMPEWETRAKSMLNDLPEIRKQIDGKFYGELAEVISILEKPDLQPDEFFVAMSRIDNLKRATQLQEPTQPLREGLPSEISAIREDGTLSPWIFDNEFREAVWKNLDDVSQQAYRNTLDSSVAPDSVIADPKTLNPDRVSIDSVAQVMQSKTDDLTGDLKKEREALEAFNADRSIYSQNASILDKIANASPEIKSKAFEIAVNQVKENRPIDISSVFEFGEGKISGQELNKRVQESFNDKASEKAAIEIEENVSKMPDELDVEYFDKAIKEREERVSKIVDSLEEVEPEGIEIEKAPDTLLDEIKASEIPDSEKKATIDFLERMNPKYMENLAVEIGIPGEFQGQFIPDFRRRTIQIFNKAISQKRFDRTFIHEFWHSLSQYLPDDSVKAVEIEFKKARQKFVDLNPYFEPFIGADGNVKRELLGNDYRKFLNQFPNWKEQFPNKLQKVRDGVRLLANDENYRYFNLDEYFAETMVDRTFDPRQLNPEVGGVWQSIKNFFQNAYDSILRAMGKQDTGVIFRDFIRGRYDGLQREGLADLKLDLDSPEFDDLDVSLIERPDEIVLAKIVVPKSRRGEGLGTLYMENLITKADQEGKRIVLSPSKDFGASSVSRLKEFYNRFGFVENKGKNKDFSISESMYRNPEPQVLRMDTESPEFKNWFGDSKVVDEDGKPLVVYHGSPVENIEAFEIPRARKFKEDKFLTRSLGIFLTENKKTASKYKKEKIYRSFPRDGRLYENYLSLKNPKVFETDFIKTKNGKRAKRESWDKLKEELEKFYRVVDSPSFAGYKPEVQLMKEYRNKLISEGYDGIIIKDTKVDAPKKERINQYVAFEPTQIKSIDNIGTFDPNDPNIYKLDLDTTDPTQVYYDTVSPEGVRKEMERMKRVVLAVKQDNALFEKIANVWPDKAQAEALILAEAPNKTPEIAQGMIAELDAEIKATTRAMQKTEVTYTDALAEAVKNIVEGNDLKAKEEQLRQLISLEKRVEAYKKIRRSSDTYQGVYGILTGNYDNAENGRISIETIQNRNVSRIMGGFVSDLRTRQLFDLFQSRDSEVYLAQALLALGENDTNALRAIPKDIVEIAELVLKYQEETRRMMNEGGAIVRKRSDFIASQSHDMLKIKASSPEDYISYLRERLDLEKTFGAGASDEQINQALLFVYQNFVSGNFIKNTGEASSGNVLPSGIGRKVSHARSLHFKDARSWVEYQNTYGVGDLHTSIINGLIKGSKAAGIMEVLGPNHRQAFKSVMDGINLKLKRQNKFDQMEQLKNRAGRFEWIMDELDGSANIPVDGFWAKALSIARTLETQRLMGGVVMSQLGDLAVAASELKYHGVDPFSRYTIPISNIVYSLPGTKKAQKELAESIGIIPEAIMGDLLERFDNVEIPGKLNELTNIFMRMTGMNAWTDGQRAGLGLALSNIYASMASQSYANLPKGTKILFKKYGISSGVWDKIRSAKLDEIDGRKYLNPKEIEKIDFNAAQKFRTFLMDRLYQGVLQPDAYTRTITTGGGKRGTPSGEIFRTMFQFKRFMASMFTQVWGRDLAIGQQAGFGKYGGIGELFVMSSLLGFISYSMKEIAKGREPINPLENPGGALAAGALQGGGVGIFGDFIFNDVNRFGVSLLGTMAGPLPGRVELFVKQLHKVKNGESSPEELALFGFNQMNVLNPLLVGRGDAAFKAAAAINATNLFYIRPVLNYLVLHSLQEAANPGYFRRQERRLNKEGRDFLIRPL